MQDLNDMFYFAEVVDRAGFAAAGRHLGVPKSKLSRRVAELEASLGVRLLQRTTRKLSLTQAGELFHKHCVAMRDAADAADEAMQQARSEPHGVVKVACPVTLAQSTLGPLLGAFTAKYPLVRLDVRVSNRVVDLVEEGFDVALRVRSTLEDSGSLVIKNLGLTHAFLVASPAQLERQGRPGSVQDLASLDTLTMSATDGWARWSLRGPHGASYELNHRPRLVADDLLTLKFAVVSGTGMCVLPDYMCADELRDGQLVKVLPDWGPQVGIVHAVFPSRRGMVPAVRRFLDFLGDHVNQENSGSPPPAGAISAT
jgi:DNA-binding transcriptional LysR family regulator